MLKIVNIVMALTPYGVCALMATTVANLGFDIIVTLAKYCVCEISLFFLYGFIVYGLLFTIFTKQNFLKLLKKYSKIALVPFSTSSSNATIPYSIQFCRSMGVSEKVAAFTIPLGATLNMDGTAIMQGMTVVFVSQLYNIDLTWTMLFTLIITITLATVGSPGMPGVVMVTLTLGPGSPWDSPWRSSPSSWPLTNSPICSRLFSTSWAIRSAPSSWPTVKKSSRRMYSMIWLPPRAARSCCKKFIVHSC